MAFSNKNKISGIENLINAYIERSEVEMGIMNNSITTQGNMVENIEEVSNKLDEFKSLVDSKISTQVNQASETLYSAINERDAVINSVIGNLDTFKTASDTAFSSLNSLGTSLSSISTSNTGGIISVTSSFNAFKTLIERKIKLSDESSTKNNFKNTLDIAVNKLEIAKKQDIINDNDLTIAKTAGLQGLLDTQAASIDSLIAGGGFKPCFSCRPQGPQNFTNFSNINWGDVIFDDTDGGFRSKYGVFTAKKAGLYQFNVQFLLNKPDWSAGFRYIDYFTGQLIISLSYPKEVFMSYVTHEITLTIPMNVNNYIYPTAEGSGSVQKNEKQWSSYSGIF